MAEILPFRGIRYNKERFEDLSILFTPPYDTISKDEQKRFYQLSPYNIIRIILGKETERDDTNYNRYTRARDYLAKWLKEGILIKDLQPSIYVYSQGFFHKGKYLERVGFIALLRLEEFEKGIVYPHEGTLTKPKEDRLNLLCHCMAHTEPIFLLYEDPQGLIMKEISSEIETKPAIDVNYGDRERHRVWIVNNPLIIQKITRWMKKRPVYIADGHHRYEVALSFRMEHPHEYIMAYLVDIENDALIILPAHRLLKGLSNEDKLNIIQRTEKYFYKEEMDSMDALLNRLNEMKNHHAFGMYTQGKFTLLILKERSINQLINTNSLLRRIDVTILHSLILGMELQEKEVEDRINYITSTFKVKEMVDKGGYDIAFLLNPTKVKDVKEVAHSGEYMPGKATYFYPKPLSGLVLHKF